MINKIDKNTYIAPNFGFFEISKNNKEIYFSSKYKGNVIETIYFSSTKKDILNYLRSIIKNIKIVNNKLTFYC